MMQISGFAQTESADRVIGKIEAWANKVYGSNDLLYRGIIYLPGHPKANGNPFFSGEAWNNAEITMSGEVYTKVQIKYNIAEEALILKKQIKDTDVNQPVKLNPDLVDAFQMKGIKFTNLPKVYPSAHFDGFAEIIYAGDLVLVRKYSKEFINQYNKINPNGLYSNLLTNYYLLLDGKRIKLNNNRSVLKSFKSIRTSLKKYMHKTHFHFRNTTDAELYDLMNWCDAKKSGSVD